MVHFAKNKIGVVYFESCVFMYVMYVIYVCYVCMLCMSRMSHMSHMICSKWLNCIGSTGKTWKSYTVVGALAYMVFFTSETDIWVQIGRGKVGLSGNILVKSNITKSKFDNVFDIRKSHRLYIHNVRKIHLLGFSVQRVWGKSLKISRSVSIGP